MGAGSSTQNTSRKLNFEDMQWSIETQPTLIISTLSQERQGCLIASTVPLSNEADTVNKCLKKDTAIRIVVYGESASDDTIVAKYSQLTGLGFTNVYVYPGGMFEWLLLQDVYGEEMFKTIGSEVDILKYKGTRQLGVLMIESGN
jgi:rhodanese-related sulfurtransferase